MRWWVISFCVVASCFAQATLPQFRGMFGGGFVENLLTYSNAFNYWTVGGTGATITSNYGAGPIGKPSSLIVFPDGSSDLEQGLTVPYSYTFSIYVKGTNGQTINVGMGGLSSSCQTLNGSWQKLSFTSPSSGSGGGTVFFGTWGCTALTVEVCCGTLAAGTTPMPYHETTAYDHLLPKVPMPPALVTVPPNGLATSPPMGWNSFNAFGLAISDSIIRAVADSMVSSGMLSAGYTYLNLDAGWDTDRRDATTGALIPDSTKFPNGIKAVADYVHSDGLKFGIYTGPGMMGCGGVGTFGWEAQDAAQFAAWGVDYVKYDWCSAEQDYAEEMAAYGDVSVARAVHQYFAQLLQGTGRPIMFSSSVYGLHGVNSWSRQAAVNLSRTTEDVQNTISSIMSFGLDSNAGNASLPPYAGSGYWNDPDMLQVGNGTLTDDQNRFQMSLWALLSAPLIAGNDIRSMTTETGDILTNATVIAIDQDSLGIQGSRVAQVTCGSTTCDIVARQTAAGWSVGVFNRDSSAHSVTVYWSVFGQGGPFVATDVWANSSLGTIFTGYTATVNATACVLLNLVPASFTYYVDSASGSDSNPGSLAQPWATVAKVNAAALASGNSIGFKDGGSWAGETLTLSQNNILFSSYGSGADPIIGAYNTNSKTGYTFNGIYFNALSVTAKDSYLPTSSGSQVIRFNTQNSSDGMPFLATSSYTLAQGKVSLKKTGSPTGNVWMELWTASSGLPVTKVATSRTMTTASLTTSFVDYTFTFDFMPQITSGNSYALVITGDFPTSGTNYLQAGYNNTPGYASGTNAALDSSTSLWSSTVSRPWRFQTNGVQ